MENHSAIHSRCQSISGPSGKGPKTSVMCVLFVFFLVSSSPMVLQICHRSYSLWFPTTPWSLLPYPGLQLASMEEPQGKRLHMKQSSFEVIIMDKSVALEVSTVGKGFNKDKYEIKENPGKTKRLLRQCVQSRESGQNRVRTQEGNKSKMGATHKLKQIVASSKNKSM